MSKLNPCWIPDVPGGVYVPVRQAYKGKGVIRWAVGSPEGPRSQTWVLTGGSDGSVYLGPREKMGEIKLSLHPAKWRMAFTDQAAAQYLPPGEDRSIERWEKPPDFRKGWRHAASVVIAMSNLGDGYTEKKPKPGTIGWFSALPDHHVIQFDVLIGEPGQERFGTRLYSEVGSIDFANGWSVWVVANVAKPSEDYERKMLGLRQAVACDQDYGPDDRTWIWGVGAGDRTPLIFDLSNLSPAPGQRPEVRLIEERPGVRTFEIPIT